MKDQLISLYTEHPKHWVRLLQKNAELLAWINDQTSDQMHLSLRDRATQTIHGSPQCAQGKIKKYKSLSQGWGFCGSTGKCACARQQVSQAVSEKAKLLTPQQQQLRNAKRQQTLQEKYGVANAGQTENARKQHQKFYEDAKCVEQAVQKQQRTLLDRHGVANARLIPGVNEKIQSTCQLKYGVDNVMKNSEIAKQSGITRKSTWDSTDLLKKNHSKLCVLIQNLWGVKLLTPQNEYQGVAERPLMQFKCLTCGWSFEKRFDYAVPPICKHCRPTEQVYLSKEEQAVADFIKSIYSGLVIQSDRSVINPYQLDILIPDKNLAIEYCGLYWHSEISGGKSWNYHAKKAQLCREKNIRLVTIFSDEWLLKNSQCKDKLSNILGVNNIKTAARKCQVIAIDRLQAMEFYNQYHIQGSPQRLGVSLALIEDGITQAVMSFNRKNSNNWELVRFASKCRVVGGASKLFTNFVRNYVPDSVTSFADLRWSQGNLYYQLGFELVGTVPAMQTYVENYQRRYHKLQFARKKILGTEEGTTEWQHMQSLGFDRIWDCGKLKFTWKNKTAE